MGWGKQLRALRASACGLTLLCACGGAPEATDAGPPPPAVDAGEMVAHEGVLELGTGSLEFEPVSDGDTIGLSRGNQGLQHVYVSLRLREVDPELAITEISLTRVVDGEPVNEPFRARHPFELRDAWAELIGLRLVTPDEEAAFGEPLDLFARVEGRDGSWAEAGARVHVVWDDELRGSP